MIEFKTAGKDVQVATVADVTIYLFKLRGEAGWRVTCHGVGLVGQSLSQDADIELNRFLALKAVAYAAEEQAKVRSALAVECLEEAYKNTEGEKP